MSLYYTVFANGSYVGYLFSNQLTFYWMNFSYKLWNENVFGLLVWNWSTFDISLLMNNIG